MNDITRIEQIEAGIDAEQAERDRQLLLKDFEEFLRTHHDHRDGASARQQLLCAFEAGAKWALNHIRLRL